MTIQVSNLILNIDEPMDVLKNKAAKKLRIKENDIENLKVIKESIDARKKDNIKFNYQVEVNITGDEQKIINKIHSNEVSLRKKAYTPDFKLGDKKLSTRPIIVGMGPAGLFAGLLMAQKGYRPIIIERGESVENRTKTVEHFWKTGELNTESNVDRKSTRLNSSHANISYAVFCL